MQGSIRSHITHRSEIGTIFPFKANKYDAIIDLNFLKPFNAKMDIKNEYLEIIKKFQIPFNDSEYP